MRKWIINWLFKYPMPEYFHAIEWYKNHKDWEFIHEQENYVHKVAYIGKLRIREVKDPTMVGWHLTDENNPNGSNGIGTNQYFEFIKEVDHYLRYGVLTKNWNR